MTNALSTVELILNDNSLVCTLESAAGETQ